jgi:acyl-CoA thioester hydrolase
MARADYPYFRAITTRWKDNDVYGHVNNVDYYSFFDTVINEYLIRAGGLDIHRGGVIGLCVESQCAFKEPLAFPDLVDAGLRVTKIGTSSVHYEIGLYRSSSEEPAALGRFVHVFVGRRDRRPVPIPLPLRAALEALSD